MHSGTNTTEERPMSIYQMKHKSILLESTNEGLVRRFEAELSGISEEDIKENRLEGNRHGLLLDLRLAGNCPLAVEYMECRGRVVDIREQLMSKHKGTSRMTTHYCIEDKIAREKVYSEFGWRLPG